jgi:hypothetical protein
LPATPFLAATLAREAWTRRKTIEEWTPPRTRWVTAGLALAMLPGVMFDASTSPATQIDGALANTGLRFRSPYLLQHLAARPDDRLIVYGYMPYFYVLAGMTPATRETWNETVILDHKRGNREAYRRRFITEFDRSRPAIIVDAVTFTGHVYRDPVEQGPRAFPAFAERLDRDYVRISRGALDAGCPQTYLRHDRAAHFADQQAEVVAVTASGSLQDGTVSYAPEHVIDRDVFEACADRWLAPEQNRAWLSLRLAGAERITRVALLNTRGRWQIPSMDDWGYKRNLYNVAAYHAAQTAVVDLMRDGEIVAERTVTVDAYPYWTDVDFADAEQAADQVLIHFPDWHGKGPGLNEVVIYSASDAIATRESSGSGP